MPKKVLAHFKKHDPVLYRAIVDCEKPMRAGPEVKTDLFASLCRIIVGQQLSGKAADAIWQKFRSLFPRKKPTAKAILSMSDAELRASGISYAKIASVKDLSDRVADKSLSLSRLRTMREDDARKELLRVRGIGPWSCEMFLMFSLGHEDVFSPGDLGLQKGIQKVYELDTLPSTEAMQQLSARWSPYRTYAACALWHILDNR